MEALDKRLRFNEYTRFLEDGNKVVVVQTRNGSWLSLTKGIFNFLKTNIENNCSAREIINQGEDEFSCQYFSELLKKLIQFNIVSFEVESKNSVLKSASFFLTNRCNLRCKHCASNSGESIKGELPLEKVYRIIDILCKNQFEKIIFTGGEIFVREDIKNILKYTSDKINGTLAIMTNGVLIDKEIACVISETVDEVHLSLDGYDEESADYIRGKGTFKKVMSVIKLLQSMNMEKITLSMVSSNQNENHHETFKELCNQMGVKPVIRRFDPVGRGEENYETLKPSNSEIKMELERLDEFKKEINGRCFCKAAIETISIDELGNVFPCETLQMQEYLIGNILESGFDMDFQPVVHSLQNCIVDRVEECKECNVRYFCASGCPAMDKKRYGNEKYRKERCNQVKKFYQQVVWG